MITWCLSKVAMQLLLQKAPMEINPLVSAGMICAIVAVFLKQGMCNLVVCIAFIVSLFGIATMAP